jgi:hypothetical protein
MLKQLNTNNLNTVFNLSSSQISKWIALSALAASMTLFTSPRATAQDAPDSADQQQTQNPDNQNPPPPPQDQRRVLSRDQQPQQNAQNNQDPGNQDPNYDRDQNQDPNQNPDMDNRDNRAPRPRSSDRRYDRDDRYNDDQDRRYDSRQRSANLPSTLTIPAGKVIFIRLNDRLSSDHSHAGDGFTATLDRPIVVNGWVVARRGDTVFGSVTTAKKAGRVKGTSELGLELSELTVVDGQELPLKTELWTGSAGTSHGADAATIATTTGVGTIVGAGVNGGEGAGIGAGIGAASGIAGVLLTRGKQTILGPETRLTFRIKEPITVSTENSRQAFQSVGPDDFGSSPSLRQRGSGGYPGYAVAYPGYGPCSYYWGCGPYYGYGYPTVGIGFGYWGGGFGHRGFGRGGFGRGGFRR